MNSECKCSLRTKLVGDGCEVCNPEMARLLSSAETGKETTIIDAEQQLKP